MPVLPHRHTITYPRDLLVAKPFSFFVYPGTGTRLEVNFDPSWTGAWREDPEAWSRLDALLGELEAIPELSAAARSVRKSDLMNRPGVLLNTISDASAARIANSLAAFNNH